MADVAAFGRRYGLGGRAQAGDVAALRAYRGRLDAVVTACEAGDIPAAVRMINLLLALAMLGGLLSAPGWLDPALSLLMVPWFLREGLTHARGRVHAHEH